jgi:hypothetical protein
MTDAGTDGWAISETGYPKDAPVDERLRFLLGYAVLAPSGHNAQPWLFRIRKGSVELHADRTRGLAVADPDDRELTLGCGCALYHLRIAIRRFGHRPETIAFPEPDDPDMLARVRPGVAVAPAEEDIALFRAIPRRRTNRKAFEPRPVEEATLAALSAALCAEPRPRPAAAPLSAPESQQARGDIRPDDLCQHWVHSSEEQRPEDKEQVFRPAASRKFPPSRFRMEYRFSRNGDCEWLWLSPDDAHRFKSGKWTVDPKDQTILRITTEGRTVSYRITALTRDLLRFVPIEPAIQP